MIVEYAKDAWFYGALASCGCGRFRAYENCIGDDCEDCGEKIGLED